MSSPPPLPPQWVTPPPPPVKRAGWSTRTRVSVGVVVAMLVLVVVRPVFGAAGGGGDHAFLKEYGGEPVTWNHCKAIPFEVNPKGAPADWQRIVSAAVADVQAASGFVFVQRGTTVKRDLIGYRYAGNEWEPVLIMWSDRYQDQELDGNVIGFGGSAPVMVGGRERYVVGRVALDSTQGDAFEQQMVLEHELGHVLGLAHSSSRGELMYPAYHGQRGFGPGDRAGLRALHDVPCDAA